jgi:protein involved in polysaccharide export with SLBB domain
MNSNSMGRWLALVLVFMSTFTVGAMEAPPTQNEYRIGPNDVIRIQVFGEDDLTVESKVSGDGKVNYPLLGVLQVAGRTVQDVQKDMTRRLGSGYLRQPKVSVSIVQHRNFYVGGEVKNPGGYAYQEGLTVQKALSIAGGWTEKSDKQGLTVTRLRGKGVDVVSPDADTLIMPDDLIVVAPLQKFYVNGEVKRPGDYPYEKGLTVHKAITMAGGFTDKASMKRVKVLRRISGDEQTLEMALDAPVLPQDIVVVRQRFF